MKEYIINNIKYELIKDNREAFDLEETTSKLTEYYNSYDYVVGDWAYGKLRLKGFYDSKNPSVRELNNYKNIDNYIANNCAFGCRYFVLQKKS